MDHKNTKKPRLPVVLTGLFLFALLMGPGPGVYLINPDSGSRVSFFGMPVLYVWALFWLVVEIAVVAVAYVKIWSQEDVG